MNSYDSDRYQCSTCGERALLMAMPGVGLLDRVVGGVTTWRFMQHGSGCTGQVWDRISSLPYDADKATRMII